jgi:DNA-binding NarL/FixJ family response regulator
MKKVYIIDDHSLFSNALKILINQFEGYEVSFCGQNGTELIHQLQDQTKDSPDIILLDINMPIMSGIETMDWLVKNNIEIPVLVLSMQAEDYIILDMIKKGAKGYLLKDSSPQLLKKALDDILNFGFFHTEHVTQALVASLTHKYNHVELKENETTFLKLLCTERTYKEIADLMFLSPKTIDGYRDTLFEKLEVKSRVGLVIYAIKYKLHQM